MTSASTNPASSPSIDEVLAGFRPVEKTVRILLDARLADEHAELEQRLLGARRDSGLANDDVPQVAARLAELEERMETEATPFTFRSVGRQKWRKLLGEHPPTAEQARDGLDHNPDTFPLAAIAASCVAPAMTVDDVVRLDAVLNVAQFDRLWAGCLSANLSGGENPKSVAGAILRSSAAPGTTASPEESLAASSSVE